MAQLEHRLIVTADDFGACDFIDNGIKEAIKKGVVSSVAAMVNFAPRTADHPWGAYKGSIQAIKELLHDVKNSEEYAANQNLRVGLHLNFHAGHPVFPNAAKVDSLLSKKRKINGKKIFKTIEKFNPDKVNHQELIKELHAQYSAFFNGLGFPPDHFSAHFPIVFMTPKFFKSVCELANPLKIPIRNPFLVWQTKNKESDSGRKKELARVRKFFRKNAQTKHIDIGRLVKMIDTMDDTLLSSWKNQNIESLQKFGIPFPDYTQSHCYGNGDKLETVDNILNNLLSFHPSIYGKPDDAPVVTEVIVHLGHGDPSAVAEIEGIDKGYFEKRKLEFERVMTSEALKKQTLHNFKTAFLQEKA